jgi:hypothetical protein
MMSAVLPGHVVDFERRSRTTLFTPTPEQSYETLARVAISRCPGRESDTHSVLPASLHSNVHHVARRGDRIAGTVDALNEVEVSQRETRGHAG